MKQLVVGLFALAMSAGMLTAGEKKLMHCFAFTPIASATSADWDAFKKASDGLPGKIPGLTKVWYGKLRNPTHSDPPRSYGMCMEFNDAAALKTYAGHDAHKAWQAAYEKVREPGTFTFDILGE